MLTPISEIRILVIKSQQESQFLDVFLVVGSSGVEAEGVVFRAAGDRCCKDIV